MHAATRWTTGLTLALLTLTGCGDSENATDGDGTADAAEVASEIAAGFVPAADQFGVATFKIVYQLEGQETGTRTMWVEDHGGRVAVEDDLTVYNMPKRSLYYWDGSRSHMQDLPDGDVFRTPVRTKASEPTAFATTAASGLTTIGYTRIGDKTIAGRTCEHWKQDALNFEGCRWNSIELEFLNGAGTDRVIQRTLAVELVEGERIPERFTALVD
jgi:hypothetical protein